MNRNWRALKWNYTLRIKEQVQEIIGSSVTWQDVFCTPLGYDYNDRYSFRGAALVQYTLGTL